MGSASRSDLNGAFVSRTYSPIDRSPKSLVRRSAQYLAALLMACAVVWLLGQFVVAPTQIQGISMQPTLHTGDVLLEWKWPLTWARITNSQYIPARGDIITVAKTPILGEALVKRVIGEPGDQVVIKSGTVTIYNTLKPFGFNPDAAYGKNLSPTDGDFTTSVDAGTVFVMGDNREPGASIDSRSSLGDVSSSNITGRVFVRVYPFDQFGFF